MLNINCQLILSPFPFPWVICIVNGSVIQRLNWSEVVNQVRSRAIPQGTEEIQLKFNIFSTIAKDYEMLNRIQWKCNRHAYLLKQYLMSADHNLLLHNQPPDHFIATGSGEGALVGEVAALKDRFNNTWKLMKIWIDWAWTFEPTLKLLKSNSGFV